MISISDPISHGRVGAEGECGRKPVSSEYECKTAKFKRISVFEQFLLDFAPELDIFDSNLSLPNWIFKFREDQIKKISPEMRKICRWLKDSGYDFKIKWPVEIEGKWKFTDVYLPQEDSVVMVTNAMALVGRPHWMLSDRAQFFKPRFNVIEVETLRELERKLELKPGILQNVI